MKSEDLLKYIGGVDDRFVDEIMDDKVVPMVRRSSGRSRWLTVAACFAVIVLCTAILMGAGSGIENGEITLTGNVANIPTAQNTVIMIDVNPSLQIEVNDRGVVVKAEALNDDAAALMDELQLDGLKYTDAVDSIISVLMEHKYITTLKNSVLVSVSNPDIDSAEAIRAAVVDTVKLIDENTDYDLSILSQILDDISDYAEIAENYSISAGRAALIEKTCEIYEEYDFDELLACSIQTINQLFEYIPVPDFLEKIGSAAATVPQKFIENLGLDELSGEDLISFARAISDFFDKLCTYYSEADVVNQIGFEFDIASRDGVSDAKQWVVVAESLRNDIYSFCGIFSAGESVISSWGNHSFISDIFEFADFIDSIA